MPSSTDSLMNSLKGRIWLAVSSLAILNCCCGLGAYLAVSFLVAEPVVSILVTFFLLAFTTMIFGWWLANEVMRPIETVTLLSKSLERSPTATLPRTSGSSETDELLRSIHRNSQQLQNLISMMDDVAAGKTEVATAPLENADRLSASFQKLVSRVTDSITAKRELDALQNSILRINGDLGKLRQGELDVDIRSDHFLTKEIADTFRFLTGRLGKLSKEVQMSSIGATSAIAEARRNLRSLAETFDESSSRLAVGLTKVKELPTKINDVATDLESALRSADAVLCASSEVDETSLQEVEKADVLAASASDALKRIQKLRSKLHSIPHISRSAHEIARRSNIIALNVSIQVEDEGNFHNSSLLVGEIASLSERTEALSREINAAGESLESEVNSIAGLFGDISSGTGDLARHFARNSEVLLDVQKTMARLKDIGTTLTSCCIDQTNEAEKIASLVSEATLDRRNVELIRESEQQIQRIATLVEDLREGSFTTASEIKTAGMPVPERTSSSAFPFERTSISDPSELLGDN